MPDLDRSRQEIRAHLRTLSATAQTMMWDVKARSPWDIEETFRQVDQLQSILDRIKDAVRLTGEE